MNIVGGAFEAWGIDGVGRPREFGVGALGIVDGVLRLRSEHEGCVALATGDALCGFVEEAHGAFAANVAIDGAPGLNAQHGAELGGGALVAPADQSDDINRVHITQETARFGISPPRRFGHEAEGFKRRSEFLRAVSDLANAGDDGNAVRRKGHMG